MKFAYDNFPQLVSYCHQVGVMLLSHVSYDIMEIIMQNTAELFGVFKTVIRVEWQNMP